MWCCVLLALFFSLLSSSSSSGGGGACPCEPNYACYPGIGCVALRLTTKGGDDAIIDCHGVCLNRTHTPTLRCLSTPCSPDSTILCPLLEDSNKCVSSPQIKGDGSCASQGSPITCPDSQACIEESGCPLASSSSPPTGQGTLNDDQIVLVIFFVVYGLLVVIIIVTLAFLFVPK